MGYELRKSPAPSRDDVRPSDDVATASFLQSEFNLFISRTQPPRTDRYRTVQSVSPPVFRARRRRRLRPPVLPRDVTMIQQRRNSRRFVLSELRTFGGRKSPLSADGSEDAAAVDSDDADDGFCIQLEPMEAFSPTASSPALLQPPSSRPAFADLSSLHDDQPPSKHEVAQWKSIKNLKSGIT